jgi:hypothetical protein
MLATVSGIRSATSSLGNRVAIEYKAHGVHGGLSESTESPANSNIPKGRVLTRQKCGRHLPQIINWDPLSPRESKARIFS